MALGELPYDLNELFADEIAPALRETCAAPLKRLGVTAREPLGCGAFGCVFPTRSKTTVVKLTCQEEEVALARFFARALSTGTHLPASIPRVYEVEVLSCASLPDEVRTAALSYEGRVLPICAGPAFAVKREELLDLTNENLAKVYGWKKSSAHRTSKKPAPSAGAGAGGASGTELVHVALTRIMFESGDLTSAAGDALNYLKEAQEAQGTQAVPSALVGAFEGLQDGLLFLQRAGITARDVSRDNLGLRPDGAIVFRDFGLFHRSGFGFDAAPSSSSAAGGASSGAGDEDDGDVVDFSLDGLDGSGLGLDVDVGRSRAPASSARNPPRAMRGLGALASCGH